MKKTIITLTGFMGSGKSCVGRELAALLDAHFADLDSLVVRTEHRSIPQIFEDGEPAFRRAELKALKSFLDSAETIWKPSVLALGGGTFCNPESRAEILARSRSVYLRTSLETIRARLGSEDASRPLFKDADRLYAEREPVYSEASLIIDTEGLTVREIADLIKDRFSA